MFSNSAVCFIISALCLALILVQKKDSESDISKPKAKQHHYKPSQSNLKDSETMEYAEDLEDKIMSITVETIANELITLNEELFPEQRIEVAKLMLDRVRNWYFVLNVSDKPQAEVLKAAAKRNNMTLLKFSIHIAYFMAITPATTPESRKWIQEFEDGTEKEKIIEAIDTEMFGFKKNDENARDFIRSIYDARHPRP